MRKQWIYIGVACVAMVGASWALAHDGDEGHEHPADAVAGEATMDAPSESASTQAATPSDEAQSRIRGIRRNELFYQSFGRKDLCAALVTGEFEPITNPEIVDVNLAKMVGIMWGATDRFALVEDGSGNGFILRVGDKVRNGRVVAVNESSLVATVTLYGITSRVVLRLEEESRG